MSSPATSPSGAGAGAGAGSGEDDDIVMPREAGAAGTTLSVEDARLAAAKPRRDLPRCAVCAGCAQLVGATCACCRAFVHSACAGVHDTSIPLPADWLCPKCLTDSVEQHKAGSREISNTLVGQLGANPEELFPHPTREKLLVYIITHLPTALATRDTPRFRGLAECAAAAERPLTTIVAPGGKGWLLAIAETGNLPLLRWFHQTFMARNPHAAPTQDAESKEGLGHIAARLGDVNMITWLADTMPTCLKAEDRVRAVVAEAHRMWMPELTLLQFLSTPLHTAVAHNNVAAARLLVLHGADTMRQNRLSVTPWYLALLKYGLSSPIVQALSA